MPGIGSTRTKKKINEKKKKVSKFNLFYDIKSWKHLSESLGFRKNLGIPHRIFSSQQKKGKKIKKSKKKSKESLGNLKESSRTSKGNVVECEKNVKNNRD